MRLNKVLNKRLSRRQLAVLGIAAFATASGRRAMAQTVNFEQTADGQAYSYTFSNGAGGGTHMDNGNFPNNNNWSQSEVTSVDGYGDGYESAPSNWSTPADPNSSTVNVNLGSNLVTLDIFVTVGTLNINTGGVLNMLDNTALTVAGATLTNNGTININSNTAGAASILGFTNGLLTGSGDVVLNYPAGNAQLNGTLTQDVHSTIEGFGQINAALTNNGTVNANIGGQTLYLQSSAMTNNSLFEATNTATMSISGISITQGTAGQITAAAGSVVNIGGGTSISGGTLSTSGGGVIQFVNDGSTNTLSNVTNNGALNILDNDTINITGNLTNNGVISVNSNTAGAASILNFSGGTLGGSGTVALNYPSGNAQLNGTLTQAASHTIQGFGEINAALTNYGLVNANIGGQTLYLQNSGITNNNLIEATNTATLLVNGITITQGTAGQISSTSGSPVQIGAGSSIIGGTLVSSSGGQFIFPNDGTTNTLNGVISKATLNIYDDDTVNVVGNLTDNGAINVNSNTAGAAAVLNFSGGNLLGTGTVVLAYVAGDSQLNGTLTQAAGHTIQGLGEINAVLTNSGIVNANVAGQTMYLIGGNKFNSATFEATNTATLSISGITINQTAAGQIEANGVSGTASIVQVSNSTLSGGTLSNSAGGYFLFPNDGATSNLNSVNNQATLDMLDASNVNVNGNLANSGTIIVNGNMAGAASVLTFNGGTVSGAGTIILNYVGGLAQLAGTLTQSSGHTIQGFGQINANLTNNGLVNANNTGGNYLEISGATQVNTSTLEATNGGLLIIDGGGTVNNSGGKIVANGGNVDLENGTTISGGILTATAPSFFNVVNNGGSGYAATFDGFTIAGGATINLPDGGNINVTSAQLTNNGTIVVNSNQESAASVVNFNGGTLTGTGSIILNYSNPYAQISGTLTQAASHTIQGFGIINAALTNLGLVDANVNGQTLYLAGDNMNNSATFAATGGGTLNIDGITINQTNGAQITAVGSPAPAGLVTLTNATISGGSLNSSGAGTITAIDVDALTGVTNNATVLIPDGDTLNVNGTLTDNGAIVVNSNQQSAAAIINFNGANLTGTGAVILQYSNPYAQLSGTLTQSASHTIEGFGVINAALTNLGLVNANANGQTLYLTGNNMNNSATFESTNGGTLNIYGITVNQSPTAQISAGGSSGTASYVTLTNATVSGGILNSPAASYFLATGTDTLASLTNNATIYIPDGDNVNVTGNLTDNGAIVVNSNEASAAATLNFSGGTLSGTGAVVLQYVGGYAQLDGTLTQAMSHTIEGFGEINAALTNLGLVNANATGNSITLTTNNMSNSATFEATNGGTLAINGITVTQSGAGQISAGGTSGTASFVTLTNATISGGILNSSPAASYFVANDTDTLASLTNNATILIPDDDNVNVTGNLIDNGIIVINSNEASAAATLNFSGGTLSGNGIDVLQYVGGYAQINGTLTQAMSHTIEGFGEINANFTNDGTVVANANGQILYVTNTTTNNGIFQASASGYLQVEPGVLTNLSGTTLTGGTYEVDSDSTIAFLPVATTFVNTNAASIILNGAPTFFPAIVPLASNSGSFTLKNGASFTTVSNLSNSGNVSIDGTSSLNITGQYTQSAGLTLDAGTLTPTIFPTTVSGGILQIGNGGSTGTVVGNILDNASVVVDRADATAIVANNISGTGTVTLTGAGTVTFTGNNTYSGGTILSAGKLVIPSVPALPSGGSVVDNSALQINAGTTAGPVVVGSSGKPGITGAGALTVGVSGTAGYVQLATGSGASTLASLTINTGSALDITKNNTLVINYGAAADPFATIRGYLQSASNGGVWTGPGLTSSSVKAEVANAIAHPGSGVYGIGYVDGSKDTNQAAGALFKATGNQIVYGPALIGDANLDGGVTFIDLGIVAQNLGATNTDWEHGDFNYDGSVNFLDVGLLAQNLNKTTLNTPLADLIPDPSAALTGQWNLAVAEVQANETQPADLPEPGMIGLMTVGAFGLLARRRRR